MGYSIVVSALGFDPKYLGSIPSTLTKINYQPEQRGQNNNERGFVLKEPIELVSECCQHEDCVYRATIYPHIPICNYAAVEHQIRGCKISECNRYRGGEPIKPTMDNEYMIYWEYDYYDEDDNSVW